MSFSTAARPFLRDALVVLVEELDLPPQDAALGVDDVLEDLHPVLDLRALHHRARAATASG